MTPAFPPARTPAQEARLSQFDALPRRRADLLVLGDSLTEAGMWSELFPELAVANRGVGGDTVEGLLRRAADHTDASVVSVLVGTNDLGRGTDPVVIAASFRRLVELLRDTLPHARLLVTGIPPRGLEHRERILGLNLDYREIAEQHDGVWIDLWPVLADDDGALATRFTYDGLHFTGAAYLEWATAIAAQLTATRPR